MRLIARVLSEEQATRFSLALSRGKIFHQYEKVEEQGSFGFDFWIHREEDVMRSFDLYQQFVLHPEDPRFAMPRVQKPRSSWKTSFLAFPLTYTIALVCALIFVGNTVQELVLPRSSFSLTPLEQVLFFDNPSATQKLKEMAQTYGLSSFDEIHKEPVETRRAFQKAVDTPFWKGLVPLIGEKIQKGSLASKNQAPLFERIREGEIWRIVSPAFMHQDILHIAFNVAWLLILARPIEARISRPRLLFLILALAAFSNTCQYLMSGCYFLGLSGVIAGLAAFIWARQSKAPSEEYPIPRKTLSFLFYFVLILFFISALFFILNASGLAGFTSPIANTAHISGGLLGFVLGRSSFFARKVVA